MLFCFDVFSKSAEVLIPRFPFHNLTRSCSLFISVSVCITPSSPPPFQVTVQPRCCRQAGWWTCAHRGVCQHATEQPRTVSAGLAPLGDPGKGPCSATFSHCFLLATSWSSSSWAQAWSQCVWIWGMSSQSWWIVAFIATLSTEVSRLLLSIANNCLVENGCANCLGYWALGSAGLRCGAEIFTQQYLSPCFQGIRFWDHICMYLHLPWKLEIVIVHK